MKNQEVMDFPSSIYEFLIDYSFKDSDEVYTNGISLIPSFRVKQAIEHYFEQTRWIPVSEKPQEGRYLCTYEHCDGKCIDFGSFDGDVWYIKPIAYMPLPEPYKLPAQTFGCAED